MALAKAVAKDLPTGWIRESEIFLRCIYASILDMGLDVGMWEGACHSSYVGSRDGAEGICDDSCNGSFERSCDGTAVGI